MPNMSLKKVEMPEQDPGIRNKNFNEVALGYTSQQAVEESGRCLNCKNKPCIAGCPVYVDIPAFIEKIKEEDFDAAYDIVAATNSLPAICGRVCPQETQCEQLCIRAVKGESVAIGRLERFVADYHLAKESKEQVERPVIRDEKVAVIGSGPASLTCAGDLAKMGYKVVIFEAFHVAGGVLMYGIPEFRLPKKIVQTEISALKDMDVEIKLDSVIGRLFTIEELLETGYSAVFIGTGAGLPTFMNIPGENLNGVYSANEFLTRINLMKAYDENADTPIMKSDRVAVVGGGNVAMDAARCAKRLGASEVYIVYRRSEVELPARLEEVHHAKEEGIEFKLLTNPTRIIGDEKGWVKHIECVEMVLGEPDDSGRRRPVVKEGSEFLIDVDSVIMAIGTSPNPLIRNTTKGLEANKWGCLVADEETGQTSLPGVFAGGDIVTGAATVILAMGAGKKSAEAIDAYIRSKAK